MDSNGDVEVALVVGRENVPVIHELIQRVTIESVSMKVLLESCKVAYQMTWASPPIARAMAATCTPSSCAGWERMNSMIFLCMGGR